MQFTRTPSIVYHILDGECLVMDASNETFHVLNPTAAWLLQICERPISVEQAVQNAIQEFDVPSGVNLAEEISLCLQELSAKGLVSLT
jgi:hypothetical protein